MFQGAFLIAEAKRRGTDYYYQDPEFFKEAENEVRQLYGTGIVPSNYVAIHVRRGDYVDNPFYVDLTETDYYRKAMSEFPYDNFMVFSDDIEWCKRQELFENCVFSDETDPIRAMNKMAGCKGIIMANSSFSWWAAYLSGGKVVAPKAWYTDGIERTKCPESWLRI